MVKKMDAGNYYKVQIADYILGNEDRHGANFGFFMDNRSRKLQGLYPLMDHDHAFSEDGDGRAGMLEFVKSKKSIDNIKADSMTILAILFAFILLRTTILHILYCNARDGWIVYEKELCLQTIV